LRIFFDDSFCFSSDISHRRDIISLTSLISLFSAFVFAKGEREAKKKKRISPFSSSLSFSVGDF